jgi:predicted AAA+ superfamily ATPase
MVWTIFSDMRKWSMALPRLYGTVLRQHLAEHRQMAFVAGPRQVGKTTTCRMLADHYLSWDDRDDRRAIQLGARAVADRLGLDIARAKPTVVAFDELHKFGKWKAFLKGFFDLFEDRARVLVTGSSRLDVYRRGGDSLMGRYFLFRMHPLTVAERIRQAVPSHPVGEATRLAAADFDALWTYGGSPEPVTRRSRAFHVRWRELRRHQLVREDIRDLTRVQELGQLETLVTLLEERSGQQLMYSNLANELGVAVETIRRWITTLEGLYFGFRVAPWFKNVSKALRKEPKWFVLDWSIVYDEGARAETFVACHLLKAVQGWTDLGLGVFELRYLRDKQKREVDFVVIRDRKPWFLVEVKRGDTHLAPELALFQNQIGARHAFQVVAGLDYEDVDCFRYDAPVVVPMRTLLSQLL